MGTLARYRKAGGFVQLVTLLEGLGPSKREQLLGIIYGEDAKWHHALKGKMLSFETICKWPDSQLMEILQVVKPLTVGTAVFGLAEEQIERFKSLLPSPARLEVKEILTYETPDAGKVASARLQMAQHVRKMIAEGQLVLKTFAPELIIPDDIEEKLASSTYEVTGTAPPTPPKPTPKTMTRDDLLSLVQKLEDENKSLLLKLQQLSKELDAFRGRGRRAA